VLHGEVIIGAPSPHDKEVVLKLVVRVGLTVVLGDVCRWPKIPGVRDHLDPTLNG
jgi:hypothetical protein